MVQCIRPPPCIVYAHPRTAVCVCARVCVYPLCSFVFLIHTLDSHLGHCSFKRGGRAVL